MSGPAGDALGTQDSMEDLVQPAIPGVQLNLGPIEPRLQAEVVQQPVAPELGPASALQSGGSEQGGCTMQSVNDVQVNFFA